jgi:S1-C subfamily serine protease
LLVPFHYNTIKKITSQGFIFQSSFFTLASGRKIGKEMSYIFKLSKLVPTLMIGIGIGSMTKIKQEKPTNTSFIADAAEKVLDSVVNITLESETTNLFKTSNYISSGSGFFINEDGTVLTNAHVVEDSTENSKIWIKTSKYFHSKIVVNQSKATFTHTMPWLILLLLNLFKRVNLKGYYLAAIQIQDPVILL